MKTYTVDGQAVWAESARHAVKYYSAVLHRRADYVYDGDESRAVLGVCEGTGLGIFCDDEEGVHYHAGDEDIYLGIGSKNPALQGGLKKVLDTYKSLSESLRVFRAARYRLYPSVEQEILLSKHFGCVRWLYNRALASKKEAWETEKRNVTRYDLSAELPTLKKAEETAWLKEVNAQSLQSALVNLDMAFTRFFREKKGFPKFKSKHHRQSFQVPQSGVVGENFVQIPKVGKLKAKISRPTEGKVKTITISKTTTGKYFASVLSETEEPLPERLSVTEEGTVGIDLGLKHYAVLSTGERIENPRPLKKRLKRLRRAQRRLSRRTKGSTSREKQRRVVARIHERVRNTRNDFLHKLTTRLVRDNQTDSFAIEDLAVSNMMKNHRLARSIADAGWGTFRTFLEYKAERVGKNILVIGRFEPSSKADHKTGAYLPDLTLKDRVIQHADGTTTCRDLNAAINIKRFALHPQNKSVASEGREITPVETVIRRSSKQESPAFRPGSFNACPRVSAHA